MAGSFEVELVDHEGRAVAPGEAGQPSASDLSVASRATLPLTRAAARERVERMSPIGWLASYGQVVVGRPNASAATSR